MGIPQTFESVAEIYENVAGQRPDLIFKFLEIELKNFDEMDEVEDDDYGPNLRTILLKEAYVKRLIGLALRDKQFLQGITKKQFCKFIGWCQQYRPEAPHAAMRHLAETYEED
jgi:hypothetical protein